MQISKNFKLQDFVSEAIFKQFGYFAIRFIDQRIIDLSEYITEKFEKPGINNWAEGGDRHYCGFRDDSFYYVNGVRKAGITGLLSQHRMGRAVDWHFKGVSCEFVYEYILKNQAIFMAKGLTRMEDIKSTISWLHADCALTKNSANIEIVKP